MAKEDVDLIRSLVPPHEIDWAAVIRDDESAQQLEVASQPAFAPEFRSGLLGITETWGSGFEGLRAIWLEWLEPWETYRVREERIEDLGDGRVVWLGRDYGTSADGSGEIALVSSAIWTVTDGKVAEVVFYTDRARCLRDAGLEKTTP